MREKYVEERFPLLMIFGVNREEGRVDVADINRDVVTDVIREEAEYLIERHDALVRFIYRLADSYDQTNPEAFKKFWYEESYDEP